MIIKVVFSSKSNQEIIISFILLVFSVYYISYLSQIFRELI